MTKDFKSYDYWNRPPVVGEKLSEEPCEMFEFDLNPVSREEQCLRAFAVGELSTGGSKIGAIDEATFVKCDDVEKLESLFDECEDMGDCVAQYNKYMLHKFENDKKLQKAREDYQAAKKAEFEKYQEWLKNQKTDTTQQKPSDVNK